MLLKQLLDLTTQMTNKNGQRLLNKEYNKEAYLALPTKRFPAKILVRFSQKRTS